jgi:three-Cys-motif partner protein
MKPKSERRPKLDQIGEWSELKLDILKKYAGAYCTILKARGLHPIYIDGFAGAGVHIRKGTKELVPGSPLNALKVEPPFEEHHWVDLDESKVAALKRQTAGLKDVHIYGGDANKILVNEVFPKIRFDHFERALCILDPYVPMKNSKSAILYYLFFAAQKEAAENIVLDILKKYRREGVL